MVFLIISFNNVRCAASSVLTTSQGIDIDAMEDPNAPVQTPQAAMADAKKAKKMKPTRGGGGGFGAK